MYSKAVNRGIEFTKSGRFAVAVIFAVGLIATYSGSNGMFLALSVGLSMIVVSGILSESSMKHLGTPSLRYTKADAGQPFEVYAQVSNTSPRSVMLGMELSVFREPLKQTLLKLPWGKSIGYGQLSILEANKSSQTTIAMSPLPRGIYRNVYFVHKTNYPLGLIAKFKVEALACHIEVLPPFDEHFAHTFQQTVLKNLTRAQKAQDDIQNSLKPWVPEQSIRHIAWKKSAGKQPKDWMTREEISTQKANSVLVRPLWLKATQPERLLIKCRTAIDLLKPLYEQIYFETRSGSLLDDSDAIYSDLAGYGSDASKHFINKNIKPPTDCVIVTIGDEEDVQGIAQGTVL